MTRNQWPTSFGTGGRLRPEWVADFTGIRTQFKKKPPEVPSFPCVDPTETAADKLSALAWRVCALRRGTGNDDPAVIRHLYDLAALESRIGKAPEFSTLVRQIAEKDTGRGGGGAPQAPAERFATMLDFLNNNKELEKNMKPSYCRFRLPVQVR